MADLVNFRTAFTGQVVYWRGPAPFHFVAVPPAQAAEIRFLAPMVTYGWGAVPVRVRIGRTEFSTSLFPRDGGYLLPVKDRVRRDEGIAVGDTVRVAMSIGR